MSYLPLRFSIIGTFLLATAVLGENIDPFRLHDKEDHDIDSGNFQDNGVFHWPWDNKDKFKCPSPFGSFADVEDCSMYYVCFGSRSTHHKCPRLKQFDKYKKTCLPFLIAKCDSGDDNKLSTENPPTKSQTSTTEKDTFKCPGMFGSFLHPTECSKYYVCALYIPTLKACLKSLLFDEAKKECKPATDVDCGKRIRPTDATSETPLSTTAIIETDPETTPEPVTEPETTPEPTVSSTLEEETTTEKVKVTAPDTTCSEDDLDCIIDDLGEKPDWFKCPKDMGGYPHPSSKKLFIFCLNWKPTVKKCGQDLIFSEELLTCVSP